MTAHYIFHGIVKREMPGIRCRYVAQVLRQRGKQFWQVVVVNHKVRHLEQSFVTP